MYRASTRWSKSSPSRRRRRSRLALAAFLGDTLLLLLLGLGVPVARAQPAEALYYETETGAGTLAIDKLTLSAPRTSTEVVAVGNLNIFGIAVAGPYIYWSFEAGAHDRGAIMRASITGGNVRRLVGGLASPASVIAVHRFVYWSDENAIGRAGLDGSRLRPRFIVLPPEVGGGAADGLASDGTHLFFSRCDDHTIGRADLNGSHIEARFLFTGPTSCPQGLAVAAGHLYWTELGIGAIGRASLTGRHANGTWLEIGSDLGPFQVVADRAHVYWTWGGVAGTPAYTGRANTNGTKLDRHFLADSIYPLALWPAGTGG